MTKAKYYKTPIQEQLEILKDLLSKDEAAWGKQIYTSLEQLDFERFDDIQREVLTRFPEPSRYNSYLDVVYHLMRACRLYRLFIKRPQEGSRALLDIGSGSGVFSFLCGTLGYQATGFELPRGDKKDVFLNQALSAWYGVPLIEHRIQPLSPLPCKDNTFDDIVIFSPQFYRVTKGAFWEEADWDFFFSELNRCVRGQNSKLYLKMNFDKKTKHTNFYDHGSFTQALQKLSHRLVHKDNHFIVDLKG